MSGIHNEAGPASLHPTRTLNESQLLFRLHLQSHQLRSCLLMSSSDFKRRHALGSWIRLRTFEQTPKNAIECSHRATRSVFSRPSESLPHTSEWEDICTELALTEQ